MVVVALLWMLVLAEPVAMAIRPITYDWPMVSAENSDGMKPDGSMPAVRLIWPKPSSMALVPTPTD